MHRCGGEPSEKPNYSSHPDQVERLTTELEKNNISAFERSNQLVDQLEAEIANVCFLP